MVHVTPFETKYKIAIVRLNKIDLFKLKQFTIIKRSSFHLGIAKLTHGTAYLAVDKWNRVNNHLGTSEGILRCLSVKRLRYLDLSSSGKRLLLRDSLI